jgi:hypothetical protein
MRPVPVLVAALFVFLPCSNCRDVPPAPPAAWQPRAQTALEGGDDRDASPPGEATSVEALCALPIAQTVALGAARPFAPNYPHCPGSDPFCDSIDVPPDSKETCFVANRNIARAERETRGRPSGKRGPTTAWDGTAPPQYFDRVDAHFHLTDDERSRLHANGFVVLDRLAYTDYASAFHDIFQEQLPLYVGIDPIFHAVFRGTELVLEQIEVDRLKPALTTLLRKLRSGLRAAAAMLPRDTVADLDLYLGVALGLSRPELRENPGLSLFGRDEAIRRVLALADQRSIGDVGKGIDLFGRSRVVDFSQLTPRGHYLNPSYAPGSGLDHYFEAVMWLSRLEFNLVSRSCRSSQPGELPNPEETPREAADAIALAEIAQKSGAFVELDEFEHVYSVFAGKREDVSMPTLADLARRSKIHASDSDAQSKLKAAIGSDFPRTARVHFMPQDSPVLPVIATLLGPRIVPDVAPLTRLVHDRLPGRFDLGAADVGFVLGHDRAKAYLKDDIEKYATLESELGAARRELIRGAEGGDVYSTWLRAVLAIGAAPTGTVPSFFQREAYLDFRMNSAIVGFGQLRHAFLLVAAQGYDAYGCEIPDGYVEPLLPAWDALLAHVRKVRGVAKAFDGMERVIAMLRDIAATEVSGEALSEPQRRWLGMVAEHVPNGGYGDTSEPPKWTGWYFDMFVDREFGASRTSAFVADYFTLTNLGKVKYIGAEGPRLGVFVVDVGGVPRAMVGPVAKGYEAETDIAQRLDDEKALAHAQKSSSWRASFAVPPAPEPPMGLVGRFLDCKRDADAGADAGPVQWRLALRAPRPVGKVSVTLLDHHADPLGPPATVEVDATWKSVAFALPPSFAKAAYGVEAIDVRVHDLGVGGLGTGPFEESSSPSVFAWKESPSNELPQRWKGAGDFVMGGPAKDASGAARP